MSITDYKLAFLQLLEEIERFKERKPPKNIYQNIYPPSHYIALIEFEVERKLRKMGYRSQARKIAREVKQLLREMVYKHKKLNSASLKYLAENDQLLNALIENILAKRATKLKRSKREVLVYYFTFPDENQ